MNHKIKATNFTDFNTLFDCLVSRLEQVGEKIVKARFSFTSDTYHGYRAIVWTKRERNEASSGV